MRHCSVQVRGLLTREELDRYNALFDVGHFLEAHNRYDLVYTVQKEIDILILPAIERLKAKGRQRDRDTAEFLQQRLGAGGDADEADEESDADSPDKDTDDDADKDAEAE